MRATPLCASPFKAPRVNLSFVIGPALARQDVQINTLFMIGTPMALLDATTPSLFSRLSQPLRNFSRKIQRRRGPLNHAMEDFVSEVVQPGDKVLQLGTGNAAAMSFLARGAFHLLVANGDRGDVIEANCTTLGVSPERLRVFSSVAASESAGRVDVVYLAPTAGFAALAAHLRHATTRLKTGGLLMVDAVDTVQGGRLYDALLADLGWRIDELLADRVAVFRKTAAF